MYKEKQQSETKGIFTVKSSWNISPAGKVFATKEVSEEELKQMEKDGLIRINEDGSVINL